MLFRYLATSKGHTFPDFKYRPSRRQNHGRGLRQLKVGAGVQGPVPRSAAELAAAMAREEGADALGAEVRKAELVLAAAVHHGV